MYLRNLTVRNFRQFGEGTAELQMDLQPGVTALVGRNDSGKSAVIDAIRYAFLTRDQQFIRVEPEDFHIDENGQQASEMSIACTLAGLTEAEKGALIEYLSYECDEVVTYVTWAARRIGESPGSRRWVDIAVRSGINGTGPAFESSVRQLLSSTYLRPLRDAEREMSPGRGSRLSQILSNLPKIGQGEAFDVENTPKDLEDLARLSLVGLGDYMRHVFRGHSGIGSARNAINEEYLDSLSLHGDDLRGGIDVADGGTERARLRQTLERLELGLQDSSGRAMGRYGLGSNNLLFMACELLLLSKEPEGLPLLLIEEPEAHLHPQRQLRLMEFLSHAAPGNIEGAVHQMQVILSTHSPNLASKIPLANLVLLHRRHVFPLANGHTMLDKGDYRFLQRFLDVTKANLFFAHGVLIVEGDAEAIILPVLANLLDLDLTKHGVSVVNVGGRGLRRFSKIFQRSAIGGPTIGIPVACIADMDVMPDCAPEILGLVNCDVDPKWEDSRRRWKAVRDFGDDEKTRDLNLAGHRERLEEHDGQYVQTFVSDHWTLEYDLAYCGLEEQVFIAALLAKNDDPLNEERKNRDDLIAGARSKFVTLKSEASKEALCCRIYWLFHSGGASKAVGAQHLAELLVEDFTEGRFDASTLRTKLPTYLLQAIQHVTVVQPQSAQGTANGDATPADGEHNV